MLILEVNTVQHNNASYRSQNYTGDTVMTLRKMVDVYEIQHVGL